MRAQRPTPPGCPPWIPEPRLAALHLAAAYAGIYGDEGGGMLMIDDDINPGLRSGVPSSSSGGGDGEIGAGGSGAGITTLYSARHIAVRHGHAAQSLSAATIATTATASTAAGAAESRDATTATKAATGGGPSSKSLSKISKLVQKTNPKEMEQQRKAREEAQRRAEQSKLSFFNPDAMIGGVNPTVMQQQLGTAVAPTAAQGPPSEAVLERNRNLAMALGVQPSTVRTATPQSLTSGWARPVNNNNLTTDEFGNELLVNAASYSDALLAEAKERRMELLKLERAWKNFLLDDASASHSLKAMDRPLRKFVHEYSNFWHLKTESFDPEGRWYVQCSKLVDTCAPYPLLSEAARKWRGPTAASGGSAAVATENIVLPTGPAASRATTAASEGWRTAQRVPLKLVPRTVAEISIGTNSNNDGKNLPPSHPPSIPASAIGGGMTRSTSTPLLSMTNERPPPPRFANLHEKERPRLQLAPRSIPTWDELEQRHITQAEWDAMPADQREVVLKEIEEETRLKQLAEEREREKEEARVARLETKTRKKEAQVKQQRAMLESAFASSSDEDDSDSDWFEGDLEFDGSDDEGM